MKKLYWKIGISLILGLLCGHWAAKALPLLRGGVTFEPAPSVSEQLMEKRSVLSTRQPSSMASARSMKPTYEQLLSWKARERLVEENVNGLLPDHWQEALRILTTYRNNRVNSKLLAKIFTGGGEEAFKAALTSDLHVLDLATALRLSVLPNKEALIEDYVQNSPEEMATIATFIKTTLVDDKSALTALPHFGGILYERFGSAGLLKLAEQLGKIPHLEDAEEVSNANAIAALLPWAKTPYARSKIGYHERAARAHEQSALDNPELTSVSEIQRHLSVETHARLRGDGQDATLDWAMTKVPETYRKRVVSNIFHDATSEGDDLQPLLLALTHTTKSPELLQQAIDAAHRASKFRHPAKKRSRLSTIQEIQRLAGDRPEVATLLKQFRDVTED